MSLLILPSPARREWLISFWLTISVSSGLLIGALLSLLISPVWFVLGVILALMLILPGLLHPQILSIPYNAWNRAAFCFARVSRFLLTAICFYIIFVVMRRTGSSLRLARPSSTESLWVPRGTHAPAAYLHQYDATTEKSPQGGWIRTYLSWAAQSGRLWTVFLLPFLVLLSSVEIYQRKTLPANIYTLF